MNSLTLQLCVSGRAKAKGAANNGKKGVGTIGPTATGKKHLCAPWRSQMLSIQSWLFLIKEGWEGGVQAEFSSIMKFLIDQHTHNTWPGTVRKERKEEKD